MVTTTTGLATSYINFTRASNATVTNNVGNIAWAGHNFLLNSENFAASSWTKDGTTVTANATEAPNGTTTADAIFEIAVTSFHLVFLPSYTFSSGTQTISVYIKANGRTKFAIGPGSASIFNINASFDLTAVTATAALGTATIESVGSGWYKISATGVATAGSTNLNLVILNDSGAASYTGDNTKGVYLWGAHLYRSDLGGMVFNPAMPAGMGTYYPTTPRNLFGYTEDFSSAYWTKGAASVLSNSITAPNGLQTADKIFSTATSGYHGWGVGITIGAAPYTISFYVKAAEYSLVWAAEGNNGFFFVGFNLAANQVIPGSGGGSKFVSAAIQSVGDGWYRCSIVVSNVSAGIFVSISSYPNSGATPTQFGVQYTGDGASGAYFWGIQLSDSASLDAYTPVYGDAVTSAAYYAPRLDYSPTSLQPLGLLVEEQRTNLLTYSNAFSNVAWGKVTASVSSTSATTAPDGTTSATKLIEGTGLPPDSRDGFNMIGSGSGFSTGDAVFSVYVKAAERSQIAIGGKWAAGVAMTAVIVDLTTGTSVGTTAISPGNISATLLSVVDVGNSWKRVSVKLTAGQATYGFLATASGNTVNYSGNGASGLYIYGAQLEAGSFSTSYIPTSASQVTRSADLATVDVSAFPYTDTQGTLVANCSFNTGIDVGAYLVQIGGGAGGTSYGSSHAIYRGSESSLGTGQRLKGMTYNNSNSEEGVCATSGNINVSPSKVAYAFAANNFAASVNGASAITDNSGTMPTGAWVMTLGAIRGGGYYLNGHIRQITYLPRRISNSDLQTRTT